MIVVKNFSISVLTAPGLKAIKKKRVGTINAYRIIDSQYFRTAVSVEDQSMIVRIGSRLRCRASPLFSTLRSCFRRSFPTLAVSSHCRL